MTRVLLRRGSDIGGALEEVLPLVYGELRQLAGRTLRGRGPASLQATDLVHEAILRLARERKGWSDKPNFMVAATVTMRRILVDRARRRRSVGREAMPSEASLGDSLWVHDRTLDLLAVEEELVELEAHNPGAAQVAELRLFGGLDNPECAEALNCSTRTIERRWRFARAWLMAALCPPGSESMDDRRG